MPRKKRRKAVLVEFSWLAESLAIGDRIKARRKELKWNQSDLAVAVGLGWKGSVSLIEQGLRGISAEGLVRVALALGVSLDWLVTGRGEWKMDKEVRGDL